MGRRVRDRETPPKFNTTARVPIPRFPQHSGLRGQPIIRNVSKPHIFYSSRLRKWICGNFYIVHKATTPVYAYRGFLRKVKSKADGFLT